MKYSEFLVFCNDNTRIQLTWKDKYRHVVTKIKASENIVAMCYGRAQTITDACGFVKNTSCIICGYYNTKTNKLYELNLRMSGMFSDYNDYEHNTSNIEVEAREKVKELIADNVTDIITDLYERNEIDLEKNVVKRDYHFLANEYFLKNLKPGDLCVKDFIIYRPQMSDLDYDGFTTCPDEYAKKEANRYIKENYKDILESYCFFIATRKELENLCANKCGKHNLAKKIKDAVDPVNANWVNVTVSKGGQEITIKSLPKFGNIDGTCSFWNIKASDRRKYANMFSSSFYTLDDIKAITYGKKTLYEKGK